MRRTDREKEDRKQMFLREGQPHGTQAHPQLLPISTLHPTCFTGEPGARALGRQCSEGWSLEGRTSRGRQGPVLSNTSPNLVTSLLRIIKPQQTRCGGGWFPSDRIRSQDGNSQMNRISVRGMDKYLRPPGRKKQQASHSPNNYLPAITEIAHVKTDSGR